MTASVWSGRRSYTVFPAPRQHGQQGICKPFHTKNHFHSSTMLSTETLALFAQCKSTDNEFLPRVLWIETLVQAYLVLYILSLFTLINQQIAQLGFKNTICPTSWCRKEQTAHQNIYPPLIPIIQRNVNYYCYPKSWISSTPPLHTRLSTLVVAFKWHYPIISEVWLIGCWLTWLDARIPPRPSH